MITRKRCPLCMHEDRTQLEADLEAMSYTADALDQQMGWQSGTSARHQRNHMGAYVESANPSCKLCTSPMRAEIEAQLHAAEVTPTAVADMLGCSEVQVMRHIDKHLKPVVQQSAANLIATREVDEIETLSVNVQRLEQKIDTLFLEEFKGKLVHKRQDTIIVHQMQVIKEVLAQNHPEVWLDVRKQMESKLQ